MKSRYLTELAAAGALLALVPAPAQAELLSFNSDKPVNNEATRSAWLSATGISATDQRVDFESGFYDGQNVSGQEGLFPAGLVVTDTGSGTPAAMVATGTGVINGSNPVGSFALTHDGDPNLVLDFSASPVDYLSFQDIDTAGSVVKVTFVGGSTVSVSIETTGTTGDSAEFFGLYRNDQPRIAKVEIDASGSPPWGIDNIEYGAAAAGLDLQSLTLKSSEVAGCKSVIGTVTLTSPAPADGVVVTLADTLAAATTPVSVKLLEGATAKTFTIKTAAVAARQSGAVRATLGSTTLSQPLAVRPMGLTSITLTPTSVVGSQTAVGKATLECNAGPGPITVDVSSNNAAVASPVAASIVVPQGLKTTNFDVTTHAVQAKSYATISGTANGISKSKKLTVNVAAAVSPTRLAFGNVAVGTAIGPLNATLTNRGAVSFSVTGISLTGTYASWFSQTNNCPANLAAGASCTISVRFTPQAALSKTAKLSIATSATSTPISVSLSGTGI